MIGYIVLSQIIIHRIYVSKLKGCTMHFLFNRSPKSFDKGIYSFHKGFDDGGFSFFKIKDLIYTNYNYKCNHYYTNPNHDLNQFEFGFLVKITTCKVENHKKQYCNKKRKKKRNHKRLIHKLLKRPSRYLASCCNLFKTVLVVL